MTIPADLMEALMVLHSEDTKDYINDVYDCESQGWSGPRVKAFRDAWGVIQGYVDKQFAIFAAGDAAKEEIKAIRDENKRLKAKLEKPDTSLRALLAKHGIDIDDLPDSNDPLLFGPPVYLGDDEELIRRSRR